MRKEILTHFGFLLVFIVLVTLLKRWFSLSYWPFLVGGILGTVLPDLDHLIYVYLLKPQELTSQRVNLMMGKRALWPTMELLAATRTERRELIFHSFYFQIIFWILAFLVISSSGSLLGRGIVLAFGLHLVVDQLLDLLSLDNLDTWFSQINLVLEKEQYLFYWIANVVVLLVLGIFF